MSGYIKAGNTTLNLPVYVGTTGLTLSAYCSKNGAATSAMAGAVTEAGQGWYVVAANAADANTGGMLAITLTDGTHKGYNDFLVGNVDPQSASTFMSSVGSVTGSVNSVSGAVGGNIGGVQSLYPAKDTALNNYPFSMYNLNGTPYSGLASAIIGQVSLDGATYVNLTNSGSSTQVSGGDGSDYIINLAAADTNCKTAVYRFTAPGCQVTKKYEIWQG